MAQKTTLTPSALPGQTYNFIAKSEAVPPEVITVAFTFYVPNPATQMVVPNPSAESEIPGE